MASVIGPDVQLSHPHDFFNLRHVTVIPNTCFVLMPMKGEFNLVFLSIQQALSGFMDVKRADNDMPLSYDILNRILHGISSAELVIADLTGMNANVFYELGLAHARTKNVLLLTQNADHVPFDIRTLFYYKYEVATLPGVESLKKTVREAAAAVRRRHVPAILESAITRTRQITDYLMGVLRDESKKDPLVIRHQAGLSSLTNQGPASSDDADHRVYGELLEKERDLLLECLRRGAGMQVVLSPFGSWRVDDRWLRRAHAVLELIDKDVFPDTLEFVVSPLAGPNLLFVNVEVLFEGQKTSIGGGFGWTAMYTDRDTVLARASVFDMFFDSARQYTLDNFGAGATVDNTERRALRRAVRRAITAAIKLGQNPGIEEAIESARGHNPAT